MNRFEYKIEIAKKVRDIIHKGALSQIQDLAKIILNASDINTIEKVVEEIEQLIEIIDKADDGVENAEYDYEEDKRKAAALG